MSAVKFPSRQWCEAAAVSLPEFYRLLSESGAELMADRELRIAD